MKISSFTPPNFKDRYFCFYKIKHQGSRKRQKHCLHFCSIAMLKVYECWLLWNPAKENYDALINRVAIDLSVIRSLANSQSISVTVHLCYWYNYLTHPPPPHLMDQREQEGKKYQNRGKREKENNIFSVHPANTCTKYQTSLNARWKVSHSPPQCIF